MTKETRVGLFVGVVIVIVFGMILTEFKGTDAPFDNVTRQPVIETDYYKTNAPSQTDLAFSPSPAEAEHAIHLASADDTSANEPVRIRILPPRQVTNLEPVAAVLRRNIDEDLVAGRDSANPQPVQLDEAQPTLAQRDPAEAPTARRPARTYRVEEGDTLTRIAAKEYGPEKRHLYTKIFEANRNQLADASSIYIGQVLTIPDVGAPAVASRRTPNGTRQVDLEGLRQYVQQPHHPATRRVYVVQSGDNLTRIARKMLKDDSRDAVHRLYEANRDKLENPDSIVEGMKLRIPS
jgi:LysM repeat protein